jgi:hypothetical protein
MFKLKFSAVVTILLGIVSLLWTIYDYIALTNAVYKYGDNLMDWWKNVSFGFIPIILFHISAFVTIYFLFGYLKRQKELLKEYTGLKQKAEPVKSGMENPKP